MNRSLKCYTCLIALTAVTVYGWAEVSRRAGYDIPSAPLLVLVGLMFVLVVALRGKPKTGVTSLLGLHRNTREQRLRRVLLIQLGKKDFVSWFNAMEFEGFDGKIVRVSFPVKFLRDHIESNFKGRLLDACQQVFKGAEGVEVTVRRHQS